MNHATWHENPTLSNFGVILKQKTVKTLCGRRVAFGAADDAAPITCPVCVAEQAKWAEGFKLATESLAKLRAAK